VDAPFPFPADDSRVESSLDLFEVLHTAVERGASDVHLKVGQPPIVRFDGHLEPLEGWGPLAMPALEGVLQEVGASTPARLAGFEATGELDTAFQATGLPRFRVNAFRQRGDISFAFRLIPSDVPNFEGLRLPAYGGFPSTIKA
jgi:twitching motility protein PilT